MTTRSLLRAVLSLLRAVLVAVAPAPRPRPGRDALRVPGRAGRRLLEAKRAR